MITFSVKSQEFARTVDKISPAVSTIKINKEVIEHGVKISLFKKIPYKEGCLGTAIAFDSKKQIISAFPVYDLKAEVEKEEFHISGKKLIAIANAFAKAETVLNIEVDKEFKLSGAGSQVKQPLAESITCLQMEKEIFQEIEIDTMDFLSFLNFGASCYGEDKSASGLDGVCFRLDREKKKLMNLSTDGVKVAYAETEKIKLMPKRKRKELEEGVAEQKSELPQLITTLVEGDQLKMIMRIFEDKKINILLSKKQLYMKCGLDVVVLLTRENSYPFDSLVNVMNQAKANGTVKVTMASILGAMNVYEIGMSSDPYMEIEAVSEGQVSFQGAENNTKTDIKVAMKGTFKKIGINEKQLKQAISIFPKDSEIILQIGDNNSPMQIKQNEDAINTVMISLAVR